MNVVFLGVAGLLAAAAGYWVLGRGTPRPAGAWAVGTLLGSFALAFAADAPLGGNTIDTLAPHLDRLISNCAALSTSTAALAVCFQLNLEPAEARRRLRSRLVLLAAASVAMTVLFAYGQTVHRSPQEYALYLLLLMSYLVFAIIDFARQSLHHSKTTRRSSVRLGLRLAAASCAFALVYTAYKVTHLVTLGLGLHTVPDNADCSKLLTAPCVLGVTVPVISVLLLCIGLTLPAAAYPLAQARRRRWEKHSFTALEPLWTDLSTAMPHIVLPTPHPAPDASTAADTDFRLQRRVIEISDAILALRPYRSQETQETVERTVGADVRDKDAIVEAAAVKAALTAMKTGHPAEQAARPPTEATPRRDLREDTEWLIRVAAAYTGPGMRGPARYPRPGPPDAPMDLKPQERGRFGRFVRWVCRSGLSRFRGRRIV